MCLPRPRSFPRNVGHGGDGVDSGEQRIELRRPLERSKLVIAADMGVVDEDLRHRAPAKATLDHLPPPLHVFAHVDLGEGHSLLAKKMLGGAAIAAIGGGVEDNSRHRSSAAAAIRPFVAPGKRGSKEIPDYSSMAEGSTALACARISTRAALARFNTLAQMPLACPSPPSPGTPLQHSCAAAQR